MASPFCWIRGRLIGAGSSAFVNSGIIYYHGIRIPVAIKSARISHALPLHKEREILKALRGNPQILHCFAADKSLERSGAEYYNLFIELSPRGSLADLIQASSSYGHHPLPEHRIRSYIRSILGGLRHMHAKGYVHCDIKPENLMVWNDYHIKIADFGLAKKVGEQVSGIRGTLNYIAPESFLREEYEPAVDVWALGCVMVEMATGRRPAWKNFPADVKNKEAKIIIGVSAAVLPEVPKGLSKLAKHFLSKCLVKNPEERWTVDMLLSHPFVAKENCSYEGEFARSLVKEFGFRPVLQPIRNRCPLPWFPAPTNLITHFDRIQL